MNRIRGRKIDAMHRFYGVDPKERICDDCPHLVKRFYDRVYYKCSLYGVSASEATDWRKKWQACMLIDHDPEPDNFVPVLERLKHSPKLSEPPVEGQIRMEL